MDLGRSVQRRALRSRDVRAADDWAVVHRIDGHESPGHGGPQSQPAAGVGAVPDAWNSEIVAVSWGYRRGSSE